MDTILRIQILPVAQISAILPGMWEAFGFLLILLQAALEASALTFSP